MGDWVEEYLLVDGYNIIHSWTELKDIAEENLDNARVKLLDILSNYKGYKKNNILVVFDAYKVKGNTREIIRYNNINVVYTKESETADHYIEKITNELTRDFLVKVATSDALEQIIILSKGAIRLSARELLMEIEYTNKIMNDKYIKKPPVNKNRLEHHLTPEIIEWMEKRRRE